MGRNFRYIISEESRARERAEREVRMGGRERRVVRGEEERGGSKGGRENQVSLQAASQDA